jgi:Fis family transcriptional regulator
MPATMHYDNDFDTSLSSLPLRDHVGNVLNTYFNNVGHNCPEGLYQLVLTEVELPLLEAVMSYTRNNQSKAAKLLGINRGTFRKKLAFYGML